MIGYTTVGSNDLEKAKTFYDAVLGPLGVKRSMAMGDRMQFYGAPGGGACEGQPGERMPNFYGAYFRDLDGNKFCVFKMG